VNGAKLKLDNLVGGKNSKRLRRSENNVPKRFTTYIKMLKVLVWEENLTDQKKKYK
jgi:hypothetical protein